MTAENKKNIKTYALSSLSMLAFSVLFSLLALVMIVSDKIPGWLQIIMSFVFMTPTFLVTITNGRNNGEKLFRRHAKTDLSNIHAQEAIVVPWYKAFYHVIGFAGFIVIMVILAVSTKATALRLIVTLLEFQPALLFFGAGVITLSSNSPVMLAIYIPYTILLCGAFVLGYILGIRKLKRNHAIILSEIRNYDN